MRLGGSETVSSPSKPSSSVCLSGHAAQVAAVMHTFFLAMLLYPDIQARARHELEAALGAYHLPSFEDFGSVPYIDALIRELLRWQPIIRLSKPSNTLNKRTQSSLRLHS